VEDDYYTFKEAMGVLGISKASLCRWINEGKVSRVMLPGKTRAVYLKQAIDTLANTHSVLDLQSAHAIILSCIQKGYRQVELARMLGKEDNFITLAKKGIVRLHAQHVSILEALPTKQARVRKQWFRVCPACGNEIAYTSNSTMHKRERAKSVCRACFVVHRRQSRKDGTEVLLTNK